MPRYFHLLDDAELADTLWAFDLLSKHRQRLMEHWYSLYVLHFGAERTLAKDEFDELLTVSLDRELAALRDLDMLAFSRAVDELGGELVRRGVGFAEVVVWTHLFEESCQDVLQADALTSLRHATVRTLLTLDKLSHVRMIVLSSSYHGAQLGEHAERQAQADRELSRAGVGPGARDSFHGLVGSSDAMRRVYERIATAAGVRSSALIVGETGTGKELVARALHAIGDPPGAPFIPVNCAALPADLIESELFGHRKGAFSGAQGEFLGLVRAAEGGTLFLDEITEMPLDAQAKLLRVVQERAVRPVGSTRELDVDVRIVASTNRDPLRAVEERRLREDLYYRLKVHSLRLPPLRERMEDLPVLARHAVRACSRRFGRVVEDVHPEALDVLLSHDWPGNVRELFGVVESAYAVASGHVLTPADLPLSELRDRADRLDAPGTDRPVRREEVMTFEEGERTLLVRALSQSSGNKSRAARLLGISRKQLYAKIRKFELA